MARTLSFEWDLGWRYTLAGRGGGRNGFVAFIAGVSMLGIALGVAALIIVLSVWNGFQKEVLERMLAVVSHVELQWPGQPDAERVAAVARELRQRPEVAGVAPFVAQAALLARGDTLRGVQVRGIDAGLETQVTGMGAAMRQGALAALVPGSQGVVLGRELARQLGVGVGDDVTLVQPGAGAQAATAPRMSGLRVVGIFESGHFEYDATLALMALPDARQRWGATVPLGLRVRLHDALAAPRLARDWAATLEPQPYVRDWTRQDRQWFAALHHQKRMMFVILVLIVAVAAFNLVSTLVMTVTDKRADIAILRTLGASPKSIMGVFVVQGATVGVMGTAAGVLLGLGVAWNLDVIVPALEALLHTRFIPADVYKIDHMPSDVQAGDIVPIVLVSLVLSLLATLYPAWRASRVNPAEALRYE